MLQIVLTWRTVHKTPTNFSQSDSASLIIESMDGNKSQTDDQKAKDEKAKIIATKRLLRDDREWRNCCHQAPSISAAPLDGNIFEWHINFIPEYGALKGIIFHLKINFPINYPLSPPDVLICNYLNHPNVVGKVICMDMIQNNWSAAYSVTSILFQLLSFLITKRVQQDTGNMKKIRHSNEEIKRMQKESIQFECEICNHSYNNPYPALLSNKNTLTKKSKKVETVIITTENIDITDDNKDGINHWITKGIYVDIENVIMDYLNITDLLSLSKTAQYFKSMVHGSKYIQMERFNCWFHRIDLRYAAYIRSNKYGIDDPLAKTLLLGYGITPKFYTDRYIWDWYDGPSKVVKSENKTFKSFFNEFGASELVNDSRLEFPVLESCTTTFDLLSEDGFVNHKIRRTPMYIVGNGYFFTHWIPMYIVHNRYHGNTALNKLKSFTLSVYVSHNKDKTKIPKYHPMMSIHLICGIMCDLVVNLMKSYEYDGGKKRKFVLYHSINVLETYFLFYHLLLAVYFKYHNILSPLIQQKCINFIRYTDLKKKKYVPNLGFFMNWFLLLEDKQFSSKQIFKAILDELLIRNVRWIIKSYPRTYSKQTAKNFNVQWAFDGSKTAVKIFMFQYYFMSKICGIGTISPKQQFEAFNKSLGCVSSEISSKLKIFCDKIEEIKTWPQLFNLIKFKYPKHSEMQKWLKKSLEISFQRGYHWSNDKTRTVMYYKPKGLINQSLFFEAVKQNDIKMVNNLLRIKNKKNIKQQHNRPPLKDEDDEKQKKDDVIFDKHMTDRYGRGPLFYAANKCYLEMVKILIDKQFNVNIVDVFGENAVKYGLNGKNMENAKEMNRIIKLLKKEMKKQNKKPKKNKKQKQNENMNVLTRYIRIWELPSDINKDEIKLILKRYGFISDIDNKSIWLQSNQRNHVIVKITETNIVEKMKNMNIAFCFGVRIEVDFSEWDKYYHKKKNNDKDKSVVSVSIKSCSNNKGMRGRGVGGYTSNKNKISYTNAMKQSK